MASLELSALVLDGVEAPHPRLSGVVLNVVNTQATFFVYFPLDRVLECFGGLHKPGQSRIHAYLLHFKMCILGTSNLTRWEALLQSHINSVFVNEICSLAHIIPKKNSVRFVVEDHHNDASVGSRVSKIMQTLTKV
jgi:hypothetical protein